MEQTGRLTTEEEEEEIMKQQQDQHRRLKPPPPENQSHLHHQQPQKCPRCDSLNTKFCYYNNYSLTQPRYFCKACRRYWTQGGTLRNVPVGGGCRKGKRSKASSSGGENSRSHSSQPPLPPPPPPQHELQVPQNLATKELGMNLGIPPMSPYYSGGGGFLSSLAAMQSLSQPQAPFNQPLNIGGQFGSPSNLALLQGLNMQSFSSLQAQNHQIQHQNEFFQMGYQSLVQPTRPLGSWNQNLINNSSINPSGSNPSGNSLNPNQWPDQLP